MNEQASVAVAVNMVDNYTKPFRKAVEAARRNTSSMVSEHKNLLHLQDASKRYQKLFDAIGAGKSKIKAHANALAEVRERARQLTRPIAASDSPTKKVLARASSLTFAGAATGQDRNPKPCFTLFPLGSILTIKLLKSVL